MKPLNGYFMKSRENEKCKKAFICRKCKALLSSEHHEKHGTKVPWDGSQWVNHCLGTEKRTAGASAEDGRGVFLLRPNCIAVNVTQWLGSPAPPQ